MFCSFFVLVGQLIMSSPYNPFYALTLCLSKQHIHVCRKVTNKDENGYKVCYPGKGTLCIRITHYIRLKWERMTWLVTIHTTSYSRRSYMVYHSLKYYFLCAIEFIQKCQEKDKIIIMNLKLLSPPTHFRFFCCSALLYDLSSV